eukprot:6643160-Ditylum_brightwellii.AAC.1
MDGTMTVQSTALRAQCNNSYKLCNLIAVMALGHMKVMVLGHMKVMMLGHLKVMALGHMKVMALGHLKEPE